jgi:hypothetical protein
MKFKHHRSVCVTPPSHTIKRAHKPAIQHLLEELEAEASLLPATNLFTFQKLHHSHTATR